MSDEAIYDTFAGLVGTFAAGLSPALDVAYPGLKFDPPDTGMWLELTWIPNEPVNYGMANEGPRLLQGLAQVSVCYRPGTGIVDGLRVAGQVITEFEKGTTFAGVRVERRPWVANVIETPERVAHPVTVPWRGFNA